ncbi:MAG: M48 family metalloprotease [Phycisphaerae bacterium]|nr:M48 family metalloprotease [Phycisphaerae bacterium]
MSQFLVIVAFLCLSAPSLPGLFGGREPGVGLGAAAMAAVLPQVALVLVVWLAMSVCGRTMDRKGSLRAAFLGDRIARWARVASTALHGVSCVLLGWPASVASRVGELVLVDEVIALSPVVLAWLALMWVHEPIERRLREAVLMRRLDEGRPIYPILSRGATVWSHFRSTILVVLVPIFMVISATEGIEVALVRFGHDLSTEDGQALLGVVQLVGVACVFLVAPLVLRFVWDAVPIGEGELRSALVKVAEEARVGVRRLLVWRTGGTMINGAAVGILPGLRFVLLTDGLLDNLTLDQVRAVAAHEFGHLRRRHLPWLGACMIACVFSLSIALTWLDRWTRALAPSFQTMSEMAGGGLAIVLGLWVFGFVSRRFEWQADAFAAQTLSRSGLSVESPAISPEAAGAMIGALDAVADLNGIPRRRRSWRHGSIHTRQMRLRAVVGMPVKGLPIDRACLWVRVGSLVLLGLSVAAVALDHVALRWFSELVR